MLRLILSLVLLASAAYGQAPDALQIAASFGPAFHPAAGFPVLTGDLDRDGAEDAVVVATAENPLIDQEEFRYKVIDPMNAFFGFGDPTITAKFSAQEQHPRILLVVHDWRAAKVKFAIINLNFEKLSVERILLKKKPVLAIRTQDMTGSRSNLYWDGKWKWREDSME